jgi:hypothetical protein
MPLGPIGPGTANTGSRGGGDGCSDRVFAFSRGDHPVAVFDPGGELLFSWGAGLFNRPHGIWIGPDDAVYCTDDLDHTVRKFTPDGKLLMTLGISGQPSDTGATSLDYRTIRRTGPPFHYPTNLAIAPSGELYISDGYGNARIHRFRPMATRFLGRAGRGPGQFHVPQDWPSIGKSMSPTARTAGFSSSPDGEYLAAGPTQPVRASGHRWWAVFVAN